MAVTVTYHSVINATETLETGVPAVPAGKAKVPHSLFSTTLNPLPGADEVSFHEVALVDGSGSIDFTALPQVNDKSLDATGRAVLAVKFIAPDTNQGPIAITTAPSNGLDLGIEVTELLPGKEVAGLVNEAVVASDEKILDVSGTGTDKLKVAIVLGAAA